MPGPDTPTRDAIVAATIELLEADGYDAVTLPEVARRARVSLSTIYKLFPTGREKALRTRDEVIVAAVEQWLEGNVRAHVTPPPLDESLHDALMRMLRYVFEPWVRTPGMLEAYHRVGLGPHRDRTRSLLFDALTPVGLRALEGHDAIYAGDVGAILELVCDAVVARHADGHIELAAIIPAIERAVFRLTTNNSEFATRAATTTVRSD